MLSTAPAALSCLALLSSLSQSLSQHLEDVSSDEHRLAVLLPTSHGGRRDGQWPTGCPPGKTAQNKVDLVLYVSPQEGVGTAGGAEPPHPPQSHCFARVRTVYGPEALFGPADLGTPSSASSDIMLYSAFLDKDVHAQLSEYSALAAIPSWDNAATATDFSVDALYDLAFPRHASEEGGEFWVKTVSLGGHPGKLHGGGADAQSGGGGDASIYNNDDKDFVGFVLATSKLQRHQQQRWGASTASRSFDEALSLSLRDSRYEDRASMFVTADATTKIGDVEEEDAFVDATATRQLKRWNDHEKHNSYSKWRGDPENGVEPKWKAEQHWKGDPENGILPKWQATQKWKTKYCDPECTRTSRDGTKGRVCDSSCDSGEPYGKKGCSAKDGKYGMFCRVCYNDIRKAQRNDSYDDRAIMCDTLEPPSVYSKRGLAVEETPEYPSANAASELASKLLVFKRD